jgi:hypothetical protein
VAVGGTGGASVVAGGGVGLAQAANSNNSTNDNIVTFFDMSFILLVKVARRRYRLAFPRDLPDRVWYEDCAVKASGLRN